MNIKKVAIYARYSSDNQREESIESQIRICEDYCKKHGYLIYNIYSDSAYTATNDNRPAFQQMIADAHKHLFDTVLVYKFDRFSRDKYDKIFYKRKLNQNGVRLVSALEHITDDPEGQLLESMIDSMDVYYVENLARNVRNGLIQNALKGLHTGGKPPIGFDYDSKLQKYLINEHEASAVRLTFEMYASGAGYKTILDELSRLEFKTKNGNAFNKNSIATIIRNEKYRGVYIFNRCEKKIAGVRNNWKSKSDDQVIRKEGGMPRIVSDELWEAVQTRIKENHRIGAKHRTKHTYLLSGKIICGYCGHTMVGTSRKAGRNKSVYSVYKCNRNSNGGKCKCKEINKTYLDQYVLSMIIKSVLNTANATSIAEAYNDFISESKSDTSKDILNYEQQLNATKKEANNLLSFIMAGNHSQLVVDKLKETEKTIANIENIISDLKNIKTDSKLTDENLKKAFNKFKQKIITSQKKDQDLELKAIIEAFVEKVTVTNEDVSIEYKLDEIVGKNVADSYAYYISKKTNARPFLDVHKNGGDGGSRTPVQKQFTITFSERSR